MSSARPRTPARLAARLTLVVLVGVPAASRAHPLTFTETTIVLRPDGSFQTDLVCDLDALALGAIVNGWDFFVGYPISPATSILQFMEFCV